MQAKVRAVQKHGVILELRGCPFYVLDHMKTAGLISEVAASCYELGCLRAVLKVSRGVRLTWRALHDQHGIDGVNRLVEQRG